MQPALSMFPQKLHVVSGSGMCYQNSSMNFPQISKISSRDFREIPGDFHGHSFSTEHFTQLTYLWLYCRFKLGRNWNICVSIRIGRRLNSTPCANFVCQHRRPLYAIMACMACHTHARSMVSYDVTMVPCKSLCAKIA